MFELIGGLMSGISSIFGASSQAQTNDRMLQFQKEMYERQRKDALSDWNMQNAYNAPSAQMQRYKDAGLNPNLIYGQSNMSQPVRSSSPSGPSLTAPKLDLGSIANTVLDIRTKQKNLDLVNEQINLLTDEQKLKRAQALKTLSDADLTNFNLGTRQEARDAIVNTYKATWDNLVSKTSLNWANNALAAAKETTERESMPLKLSKLAAETALKQTQQSYTEEAKREMEQRIKNYMKRNSILDQDIDTYEWTKQWSPAIAHLLKLLGIFAPSLNK